MCWGCISLNADLCNVAMKHTTSKLREFSDLETVETLGFRGEALNSLCSISDVEIATCCEGEAAGTLLRFDRMGNLISEQPQARQVYILQYFFFFFKVEAWNDRLCEKYFCECAGAFRRVSTASGEGVFKSHRSITTIRNCIAKCKVYS